jgi:anaerobic ribonucleoside-triphosphate reductase
MEKKMEAEKDGKMGEECVIKQAFADTLKKETGNLKKRTRCEVYSRVVGYLRPVSQWNLGKQQEFKDRKNFINRSG